MCKAGKSEAEILLYSVHRHVYAISDCFTLFLEVIKVVQILQLPFADMSKKYVVHYFEARGRAEIIRLTLKAAGLEFEDHRFTREQWPEEKKKAPAGLAPWVETPEGEKLSESAAISRYIAQEHGLYGKTAKDNYYMERAIGAITDVFNEMMKMHFSPEADKEQKKKVCLSFVLFPFLPLSL